MYLPTLTDRELLTYQLQRDQLAVSDVEQQLAARLEAALDEAEETAPLLDAIDKSDFGINDIEPFLESLAKHGIETVRDLDKRLQFADAFRVFADDHGEAFTALHQLINQAQES